MICLTAGAREQFTTPGAFIRIHNADGMYEVFVFRLVTNLASQDIRYLNVGTGIMLVGTINTVKRAYSVSV